MISHFTLLEEVKVIIWWSVIFWYLNQNEKEAVEKPLPQTWIELWPESPIELSGKQYQYVSQ